MLWAEQQSRPVRATAPAEESLGGGSARGQVVRNRVREEVAGLEHRTYSAEARRSQKNLGLMSGRTQQANLVSPKRGAAWRSRSGARVLPVPGEHRCRGLR
jgi:hypothetical protein